jgi:hypothetical protein
MTRRVSRAVEDFTYDWACGLRTNREFKAELAEHGYSIDLRQADLGNILEVVEVKTGLYYDIEI